MSPLHSLLLIVLSSWPLRAGPGGFDANGALVIGPRREPFTASLIDVGPDWQFTFDVAGSSLTLPSDEVTYWGRWSDSSDQPLCLLVGENLLPSSLLRVGANELVVESRLWHQTVLPRRLVRGLIFHPPIDPLARDRLSQRVLNRRAADDCLWLANGDQLSGRLVPGPPVSEGDLFGLPSIHFLTPGATVPLALDLANVLALSVASPENDHGETGEGEGARLGFRDGTSLLVRQVKAEDGLRRLDLGDGLFLSTESTRFRDEVSFVQPCGRSTVYLSDREPLNYRHVPFLDLPWPFGRDRNVLGGRLRVQDHVFPKGLGMHSTSRLVFDLSGNYREFAAELALDDSALTTGSVNFRVFLEFPPSQTATSGWQLAYESPTVRGGDPPTAIRVDLRTASRIALVVDFADHGDTLDRANWLNARLIP